MIIEIKKERNKTMSMNITNNTMEAIASYMNDEIREKVHFELAPCSNEAFIRHYCEYDTDFEDDILKKEFGLCL